MNGSAVLIEKKLQRTLLYFPCRHHINELLLKCVFEVYWDVQSGPNVPFFNNFQKNWKKINQSKFETGLKDKTVKKALEKDRIEILSFIEYQLEVRLVFLGTWFLKKFKFIIFFVQIEFNIKMKNLFYIFCVNRI